MDQGLSATRGGKLEPSVLISIGTGARVLACCGRQEPAGSVWGDGRPVLLLAVLEVGQDLDEIAGNLSIGLPAAPGGLPSNIPTGVGIGATGTIYFSSDIENAIYKAVRK